MVERLFLVVPQVCLRFVIVVFLDHTHLLFLLDITIITLKKAGDHQDLGDGSLYIQLQKKLPQVLLVRYYREIFENNMTESVDALQT